MKGGEDMEPKKRGLVVMTPKQKKFCVEYLKDLHGTKAAIRAGYSEKSAAYMASHMLAMEEIRLKIKAMRRELFKKDIMEAEEVEYLLSKAARGDMDEKVLVSSTTHGVEEHKFLEKPISNRDRLKALELMGKRNSLFTEKVSVSGEVSISVQDRLKRAREKATEVTEDDQAGG